MSLKAAIEKEFGYAEPAAAASSRPASSNGRPYAQAALRNELDAVASTTQGQRNERLNKAAFALGQLVAGGELPEAEVVAALSNAARQSGLNEKEIVKTIRSGISAGSTKPRTVPEGRKFDPVTIELPEQEDFWDERAYLKHIRDAAHSRQRSAPAVLGVVLARTAAMVSHRLRIPAIVGSPAGLSLITVVLAPPGVGKSTANAIGSVLLPVYGDVADQLPIGSGEGFAEVFFGMVEEAGDNGKSHKVRQQIRNNAYFFVDEGQVLAEIGSRKNATLLPTIRSAFSGATLGQTNASEERKRIIPSGSYTVGITVAMQTVLAGALLEDAEGGTPQRMLWLPAIDPTIPDRLPPWPGKLPWAPPSTFELDRIQTDVVSPYRSLHLTVAESVKGEIRAADLARARGQSKVTLLDAHEGLLRLKVAALLALLDGRLDVSEDDWRLSGVVKAMSDATRGSVERAVRRRAEEQETERSARLARRAADAESFVVQRKVVDCSRKVAEKIWAEPDRWTFSGLRRWMSRWRDVFPEAVERAVAEGWVVELTGSGQGDSKRLLQKGEKRPS